MDTQELGGADSGEGVRMSKESTRSRHSEEFKVEAAQLVCSSPERSICQLTVEMMSRLVSKASVYSLRLRRFTGICRKFRSEPPRTRTWNLEIKSLSR